MSTSDKMRIIWAAHNAEFLANYYKDLDVTKLGELYADECAKASGRDTRILADDVNASRRVIDRAKHAHEEIEHDSRRSR